MFLSMYFIIPTSVPDLCELQDRHEDKTRTQESSP